jgi:putative intracellular protease/amidase
MKVLIVLTSHSELGHTGEKTGFWVEEFAAPYYVLADAGVEITIASPQGGQPPIDPKSKAPDAQTPATKRFNADPELIDKLALSHKLSEINESDYDAVFYPGGHGSLWDLTTDKNSTQLIEDFYKHGKPIAFVCHAPAALLYVNGENGKAFVHGKQLTAFSNTEEEEAKLTNIVPFLLETELKARGAEYSKGENWKSYVKQDGLLITGQNPASSEAAARLLLEALNGQSNFKNTHSKDSNINAVLDL